MSRFRRRIDCFSTAPGSLSYRAPRSSYVGGNSQRLCPPLSLCCTAVSIGTRSGIGCASESAQVAPSPGRYWVCSPFSPAGGQALLRLLFDHAAWSLLRQTSTVNLYFLRANARGFTSWATPH